MATKKRRKPIVLISHQRLLELLSYDPKTGIFRWRVNRQKKIAGDIAGTTENSGYIAIVVEGVSYKAHVLAWSYVHGKWPDDELDHKDTVRSHNWIENLRPADRAQNSQNTRRYSSNTSGYKGVSFFHKKWRAQIQIGKKKIHLGSYDTPEEAYAVYLAKAAELFGEFYNPG